MALFTMSEKTSKLKSRPPEETKPGKTKTLLYGASGVGKTWFALSFPAPFYFDTEQGADLRHYQKRLKEVGGGYMGPADGTLSFPTLIEQIQALATETHPYRTLVIDSITKLYQVCIAQEAEKLGEKDAFGASKKPAIANMRRLVNWIGRLDMNVLFIAHEATEWGLVNGTRSEIGKAPDVWDKLIYELHLTLAVTKQGPARTAAVRKSRLTGFPEGERFPLEYADFALRYGKDFIEDGVKSITVATAEQVAEVKRLLETVRVTEEEILKGFTKAGVDAWDEMTDAQIITWINFLKKKAQ